MFNNLLLTRPLVLRVNKFVENRDNYSTWSGSGFDSAAGWHKLLVISTKKFIIFSLKGDEAIRQYLFASTAYLKAKANGVARALVLYPFPDLDRRCLLCERPNCARWKGYFVRQYQCGRLGSCGLIAIHAGHCKSEKRDFCYFPDFLVPGRRLSRKSFEVFIDIFQKTHQIRDSIDQLISRFESDVSLALSSAYNFLYAAIRPLRINHEQLMILAPVKSSVFVYYDLPKVVIKNLFSWSDCAWTGLQEIILHPP